METLHPICRRASQHPRRANRSARGTRPSCTLTARPCAARQKAATTPLTNHNKNTQPRFNRNQQYSITAVSDGGGTVVERYAYSAYGQVTFADASGTVISDSAISNRYTYTGREWDEGLNLYHYRARMYDAVSGRFVSRDPIGYADGVNMFSYTSNMPLIGLDPTGLQVPIPLPRITTVPRTFPRIYTPPPRPFFPPPPVPAIPHGGPNPAISVDPHPVHDPDAVDLPPPGRCTQARYDELFDAVGSVCKGKKRPQACGFWGWSCSDYSEHEKLFRICSKARRNMMNECFGGGNPTHRKEAKDAEDNAKKCEEKFFYWCFDRCPDPRQPPLIAMN